MTHVLLIRPLCEGDELEFAEPLGIERLAGYLRMRGKASVTVLDRRLYERERSAGSCVSTFWEDVRAACDDAPPVLAGFSLMTARDVPDALRLHSRLRTWYPQARFWAGGVYVTTSPAEAARRLPASILLVRGEGEASLLGALDGEANALAARPLHPNEWAPAYRPHVERYASLGCAVNVQTSRGCPGACVFCATPQLPYRLGRWRPRSLSLVADELEYECRRLERGGLPPVFNLVDDDFGPLSRLEELAHELRKRELTIAFACEMRLAALIGQPDLAQRLARLREAGLSRLFVGVESLNPQTLKAWHKPYDVGRLEETVVSIREAGISLQSGYIMWHRNQTVEGALAEAEELRRLGLYTHQAAVSRLIVFDGCELAKQSGRGAGFEPMSPEAETFYSQFVRASEGLQKRWVVAAVAEPYLASCALLDRSPNELQKSREELARINDCSYELLRTQGSPS